MPFYSTYISLRLCLFHLEQHITKMLPIIAYTLFQPCSQVSHCSPHHVFWYRWNLLPNCDLEVIDGQWSSGVHFRFEVPPKEIITCREIGRTCRPFSQFDITRRRNSPDFSIGLRGLHFGAAEYINMCLARLLIISALLTQMPLCLLNRPLSSIQLGTDV
jgi:hypothetical protein